MINPLDYKGKGGVYMITQPDGRYYIGSSKNLYGRFRQHKSYEHSKRKSYKFNFTFSDLSVVILEYSTLTGRDLKMIEDKYIKDMWSEMILNKEDVALGRNIKGNRNPMKDESVSKKVADRLSMMTGIKNNNWKGGLVQIRTTCPKCGGHKYYYSKTCLKCRPPNQRDSDGKFKKNKILI